MNIAKHWPRHARVAALAVLLIVLAGCTESEDYTYTARNITDNDAFPALAFNLISGNGAPVDQTNYDEVRLTLLFFGYTHCPDVCPLTLSRISNAIAMLNEPVRDDINVLFVSVDPKRDTPARLKAYTAHFGQQFIGLTGTQKQLREFTQNMHVTYSYDEPNEQGFYLVSHSSAVVVFDAQGRSRLMYTALESADALAADLETLLKQTS